MWVGSWGSPTVSSRREVERRLCLRVLPPMLSCCSSQVLHTVVSVSQGWRSTAVLNCSCLLSKCESAEVPSRVNRDTQESMQSL